MKRIVTTFAGLFFVLMSISQEPIEYFLPENINYKADVPNPEDFFNQQLGEWHLTHDQVLQYMKEIARLSDRAILYEYARSYENRPLVHLVFTSPENQKNLKKLKELHYNFSEPGSTIQKEEVPLVVSLTYGVHGNESSASNSSVLTAYHLAAAEGNKIEELLEKTIVIVDPCLNPDGFVRHSTWANMHQSIVPNGDNNSRQFDEVWPGGRYNHYWFDLNRDYLLLVHPETRGRVKMFHEWKPNLVTDHHEMSANSTFFFQPGVPSRNNPLTPERNYELTHEIAKYHARYLDDIGSPYFSEERFDDYYFGKGSSYPDINGSLGILFEQAGFRGRVRKTENGLKTLAFAIKNQFTVSLSSLEAAVNLHNELLEMQKDFYTTALELAEKNEVKAYVFGNENDKVKTQMFVRLLNQHQIKVFGNESNLTKNGVTYKSGSSFIVPTKQKQFRLIHSIFEEVTSFTDTTFYDVSTWTFPHAFDLSVGKIHSIKDIKTGTDEILAQKPKGKVIGGKSSLGYLFLWNEFTAPTALYQLQKAGLSTKVAGEPFTYRIDGKETDFTYGSILVQVSNQKITEEKIFELVSKVANHTGIDFYGLSTGLSPAGIDMGSGSFSKLELPRILLFAGEGSSSGDLGEIWHLFDQQYKIPVTIAESESMRYLDLENYTTLILTGSFSNWDKNSIEKLKNWVSNGGTVVAYKGAASFLSRNDLGTTKFKKQVEPDSTRFLNYAQQGEERNYNYISGAIFKTKLDLTHPLCYGYLKNELAVFKTGTTVAESLDKKFAEPVKYTTDPYVSGWVSEGNLKRIKNAPVVSVQSYGNGNIISYHDNMNFRGIWPGTSKLFSNSVFFGGLIR